jgi:hypothetical protein
MHVGWSGLCGPTIFYVALEAFLGHMQLHHVTYMAVGRNHSQTEDFTPHAILFLNAKKCSDADCHVEHSFSVRRMCPGRPIQLTRGDPVPTVWHLGPRCVVPISLPRRLSPVHPLLTEILLQIPQSSLGFLAGGGARVSFSALRRSMWGRALSP